MKKSLLALAVFGAYAGVASAQSSVTLYGTLDVNGRYVKADGQSRRFSEATDGIAGAPGKQPDAEGAGEPERVEQAGTRTQLVQTLLRPDQMVGLVTRRLLELEPQRRAASRQRLGAVERLGTDLADVIDPHQRSGEPLLLAVQRRGRGRGLRCLPDRPMNTGHCTQRGVGRRQQAIDRR